MDADKALIDQNETPAQYAVEDEAVAAVEPIKITNLSDCLERVFSHLDATDLFNLAESNLLLRGAAQWAYYKIKTKPLSVVICGGSSKNFGLKITGDTLQIRGLKHQLHFLRYFGHMVSNLNINYHAIDPNRRAYLNEYINEFCANALIELNIFGIGDENEFNKWTQPFKSVEKLSIEGGMIEDLIKWFPKVIQLNLNNFFGAERKVEAAIRSQPQLQRLAIGNCWNKDIFRSIKGLPALETLTIHQNIGKRFEFTDDTRIQLPNVNRLNIHSEYYSLEKDMPFTFDQIEELNISTVFLNDFIDFFSKRNNHTIKKLTMTLWNDEWGLEFGEIDEIELQQMNNALPSLMELHVNGRCLSIDEVVSFCNALTSLETFYFQFSTAHDYEFDEYCFGAEYFFDHNEFQAIEMMDNLLMRLANDWQGRYIDKEVKIERKREAV